MDRPAQKLAHLHRRSVLHASDEFALRRRPEELGEASALLQLRCGVVGRRSNGDLSGDVRGGDVVAHLGAQAQLLKEIARARFGHGTEGCADGARSVSAVGHRARSEGSDPFVDATRLF